MATWIARDIWFECYDLLCFIQLCVHTFIKKCNIELYTITITTILLLIYSTFVHCIYFLYQVIPQLSLEILRMNVIN